MLAHLQAVKKQNGGWEREGRETAAAIRAFRVSLGEKDITNTNVGALSCMTLYCVLLTHKP